MSDLSPSIGFDTGSTGGGGGGAGTPGGSSGQVQYNDGAGGFAGTSGATASGTVLTTVKGVLNAANTGLSAQDTDDSHKLSFVPGSNLTANRVLTITTGDAARTLDISGGNLTASGTHSGTSSGTNTGDQTITLTSDVTGSGTGTVPTTLATVNSNVGSFTNANITVNAKGLVTAAANGSAGGGGTNLGLVYAIASGNLLF